jgi:hypothetical protein
MLRAKSFQLIEDTRSVLELSHIPPIREYFVLDFFFYLIYITNSQNAIKSVVGFVSVYDNIYV